MRRSTARVLALLLAPAALVLAGCSAGLSNPEVDACNSVHAWVYGGQGADWFEHAVTSAQDSLAVVEESALVDPLAALAGSSEGERASEAETLLAVCGEHGWEPPEG